MWILIHLAWSGGSVINLKDMGEKKKNWVMDSYAITSEDPNQTPQDVFRVDGATGVALIGFRRTGMSPEFVAAEHPKSLEESETLFLAMRIGTDPNTRYEDKLTRGKLPFWRDKICFVFGCSRII